MVRFWGRANRNSAPRKRSVACSFWPFDRHKKSNPDNYRASEPSEVHLDEQSCCLLLLLCTAVTYQYNSECLQTHSKRSLRSSSKSHSRKRQVDSDLIDSVVNDRDLSHLSFSRPAPLSTPAIRELLAKVNLCWCTYRKLHVMRASSHSTTVCPLTQLRAAFPHEGQTSLGLSWHRCPMQQSAHGILSPCQELLFLYCTCSTRGIALQHLLHTSPFCIHSQ